MKFIKVSLVVLLSLALCHETNAQTGAIQQARIEQGVRSGELTRHEKRQLKRQQRRIRRDKKKAAADGVVTKAEKRKIRREQRRADRNIYRKKHNRRDRD